MRSPLGTKLTGVSNLAFLFLICSGLLLWLPRRWTKHGVKAVSVPRLRASGRARDWNWHHVAGIWFAPFLIVIVGTGAFMSYQWPTALVAKLAGDPPPAQAGEGGPRGGGGDAERRAEGGGRAARGERGRGQDAESAPPVRWAMLFLAAERQSPGWASIQARLPREAGAPVSLTVSNGGGTRPDQRATLTLDPTTGAVKELKRYGDNPFSRRVRMWVRPLHTGEGFGLVGQTLAALASAAGALLVWTGFALAWRRMRSWLNRRARS
jgi:uncharacterized iron-regulated membrane protein